nr:RNA polymerase sigma-70 factor [uncultured Carboxylicivirga sp.]
MNSFLSDISDDTLIRKVRGGDENAFGIIFKAYFPRLLVYAKGMVGDQEVAEDLVQEAFASVWEKRYLLKDKGNLKSFLFRAVRNICLNHLDHNKVVNKYIDAFRHESASQGLYMFNFLDEQEYEEACNEMMDEVHRILKTLPPTVRQAFVLSRIKELKNQEVAEQMGLNIKTVEKHISRALKTLRDVMKNKDIRLYTLFILMFF